jgi:hypothetical protein
MGFDVREFDLQAMLRCGLGLQRASAGAACMEEVAREVVRYLYSQLRDGVQGPSACALVRFFTTLPLRELPQALQREASRAGSGVDPGTRCLTLLGTAGEESAWNDPWLSRGHQVIPLTSVEAVARAPMIARLLHELGVDVGALVGPGPRLIEHLVGRSYNVFHVEEAAGSPHIPVQEEFVERYGIRSVVGFGGMLPRGELFAVILFSRVPIPPEQAMRFRKIATDVKALVMPFGAEAVFHARA